MIWQKSMDFGETIFKLSQSFPKDATRSLAETVTCLYKAKNRNYISEEEFKTFYDESYNVMNPMIALEIS
ncbi:hypothetical protein B0A69_15845 [Chryseobacterium shigense]|nr:hypothetical protein B0A69_15845 [Chryseobacterium shigense]